MILKALLKNGNQGHEPPSAISKIDIDSDEETFEMPDPKTNALIMQPMLSKTSSVGAPATSLIMKKLNEKKNK